MRKDEFSQLFLRCVREALLSTEMQIGMSLSKDFDIELHGAGCPGEIVSRDRAIDKMYLRDDLFYRIIDIGVKAVKDGRALVFVRISSHQPSTFDDTWNTPRGNGPFKLLERFESH